MIDKIAYWRFVKKKKIECHVYFGFGADSWDNPSLWWTLTLHGFNTLLKMMERAPVSFEEDEREQTQAQITVIKCSEILSIFSSRCPRNMCWWNNPIQTWYWKQSLQQLYISQILILLHGDCWLGSFLCQMHKEA